MVSATRVLRVLSLLAFFPVLHAAEENASFRVLVTPDASVPRPLPALQPEQIQANVDATAYHVGAVQRDDRLATSPIVIVADFANTAPQFHPCIITELLPVMRKFETRPGVTVLANGPSSEFVHHVDIGSGAGGLNLLVSRYDDATIHKACDEARRATPDVRFEDPYFSGRDAAQTMWGTIQAWQGSNQLVRVFWISGDFAWFDSTDNPICPDKPGSATCNPESRRRGGPDKLRADYVSELSKAGMSLFPVLLPSPLRGDPRDKRRREPMLAAQYMAAVGGGFAVDAGAAEPGISLQRAVELSGDAYRVELSGPAKQDVGMLSVTLPTAAGKSWRRPLVVDPQKGTYEDAMQSPFRAVRVFLPSKNFAVRYGCPQGCDLSNTPSLSLFVPDYVANATPGKLFVLLDYIEPSNPFKYRKTFRRAPDSCLCMEIEEPNERVEFRIVIYDDVTGWVAAATVSFGKRAATGG